jgi:5-methyltetrahydrofolate--homocysteine methyltransferase
MGIIPEVILTKGLVSGMEIIADRFKKDEIFLPEVLIAARAMNTGLSVLPPSLIKERGKLKGKIVLGTVRGDLHDVGKNIVSLIFRGAGFEVFDLGIDVSKEKFVQAVKEYHPHVVGISALLTMTLPMMKETIEFMEHSKIRESIIIMVGESACNRAVCGSD